ncbi:MAG TPA: hypothetical protein VF731_02575 [Solirubrobacterales bacterium]
MPEQDAAMPSSASTVKDAGQGDVRYVQRTQECPEKTDGWLFAGWGLLTLGGAAVIGACTVGRGAAVHPQTLWVASGLLAIAGVICFVAHREVNRGRGVETHKINLHPDA